MDPQEIDEFVGSPINVEISIDQIQNDTMSTLPLLALNDDCWDDYDFEMPELMRESGSGGSCQSLIYDKCSEEDRSTCHPYICVDQTKQDCQQQTWTPIRTGALDFNSPTAEYTSSKMQPGINASSCHQLNVDQQNSLSESNVAGQTMSKNAIAARENRQKKKKYVENLEKSVATLNEENNNLKSKVEAYETTITRLNSEVNYLKNVLLNQSTLSALLQNIQSTPGIKLKTSLPNACTGNQMEKNKGNGLVDNQENVFTNLRRSKRKSATSCSESYKKVRKVLPINVAENPSSENAPPLFQVHGVDTSTNSVTNNTVLASPKSTERFENQITSGQRLNGGVCLHVTGEMVSLEFCQWCNNNSQSDLIYNDHAYFQRSHDK